MPQYQYKCNKCNRELTVLNKTVEDRDNQQCPSCGALMERPIGKNSPLVFTFNPITLKHVAEIPVTFESRRSRDEYLKSHNMTMDK